MAVKMAKFRELDSKELGVRQGELEEELFRLRFQIASGQMEGLKRYREARRDLARVNMLIGDLGRSTKKESHGS
ncbi:MAG TPA: 50S ribosomal protein L29 [Candidatus Dormibacteraeota bacterium]|nr:50S ribosomal protein L29 [Candidatus Dormibacteraeota bacterium]